MWGRVIGSGGQRVMGHGRGTTVLRKDIRFVWERPPPPTTTTTTTTQIREPIY